MNLILLLFLMATTLCGYGAALLMLIVALQFAAQALRLPQMSVQFLLALSFVLSVPLSAFLAGKLLDRFCLDRVRGHAFSVLGLSLVFMLAFQGALPLDYFSAVMKVLEKNSFLANISWLLTIGSAIAFCGSLAAFCLMTLVLIFEVPVRWALSASRSRALLQLEGLRPLLLIMVICLAFNGILGLFAEELWPVTILRKLKG